LETKDGTFFDSGSATLNKNGRELLQMLAGQLGGIPNRISIEGHTDAAPFATKDGYGNWELSSDRANAARRVMQDAGLRPNQVSQVRGYADQKLRVPSNPLDPSNRRISLIVQYLTADQPPVPGDGKAPGGAESGKPESTPPSLDLTAPGSNKPGAGPGAEKPAAAGEAKGGSEPRPGSGQQPPDAGSQKGAAPLGGTQATPGAKPSAAKPASGNVVSRWWQKVHPKKS
jgi:chemotaxis protein MotB